MCRVSSLIVNEIYVNNTGEISFSHRTGSVRIITFTYDGEPFGDTVKIEVL